MGSTPYRASALQLCKVATWSSIHTFARFYRVNTYALADASLGRRILQMVVEDAQEEFGWKLVHGDIFRPPRKGMLLSVFLGSGAQILIMTFITLFFACLGFLSPANRGALMTCAVVLWVLLGTPAGYVASRFYKFEAFPAPREAPVTGPCIVGPVTGASRGASINASAGSGGRRRLRTHASYNAQQRKYLRLLRCQYTSICFDDANTTQVRRKRF
ncbi:unnamed protein product [Ranitomeya imitator]|uniref:Transmembrane 9 superfamily member n=1 Tax=Ranitomeya imitator TaxID=111125 RepID=A0ABN9M642_9NEOB|nr:unnamed protein product [Ranitomeya imitator]